MAVIPRTPIQCECTDCEWQGTWAKTDSGMCPECGAECIDTTPDGDDGDDDDE